MIPSLRLLRWGTVALVASLALVVFPEYWPVLAVVDAVLLTAAVLDALLTPGPNRLEVRRLLADRMFALDEHEVILVLRNRTRARLSVRLRDTSPAGFSPDPEEIQVLVPPEGESRASYRIVPATRGLHRWDDIHVRYRSLLGLWERQRKIPAAAEVKVYPNVASLYRYHLLARANQLEALGIRRAPVRGGAWEFESLRDYARGDDIRLIDWKATARRSRLTMRNQQAERNQTVLLLLDCGRLMSATVEGVAKLDHAVNTALLLAHVALLRGDRVGLCSFSHRVHAWVPPRARLTQMRPITETLYDLAGDTTESDHGGCLRLLRNRHRKRALLVVFTDFVDADTASDMVAYLQRATHRHLVLFASLRDPALMRAARSRPRTSGEGFRKTVATELLNERREVLERLRQQGILILDTEPADLTSPLINRYLEITARGLL